jgi:DNA-binding transcriptional regulator GbsR (MarR family)
MFNHVESIRAYFFKLGFEAEIVDIYLALYTYGPQTLSELARNSGVERTRIYRRMDEIMSTNLVEVETRYKRHIFHAAPVSNLQVLISKKEQEVRDLQAELAKLTQDLENSKNKNPATRIQSYRGSEGLKQMFWNQTKSTTDNLSILYENMQIRTNVTFFERWTRACNDKNIQFRGIINDHFISTQQDWYGKHANERLRNWTSRYMSDDIFPITHSVVIYNDVTSYFNWKGGEIFGIEIHNGEIANMQRQFFEMLWMQARPVDDLKGPAPLPVD